MLCGYMIRKSILPFALAALVALASVAEARDYPNPDRYEKKISAFEAKDAKNSPEKGAIVCIGSSSMRGWKTIKKDLAPLTVIQRGFGGSNMNDVVYFMDRVVLPYEPRAVLLYEGDNDLAAHGATPEKVMQRFETFLEKLHAEQPDCRVYVMAVKPSLKRMGSWPEMQRLNEMWKERCAGDERLTFIDIATPMLKEDGEPKPEIFKGDGVHMNSKGYDIWTEAVKPVLMEHEAKYE